MMKRKLVHFNINLLPQDPFFDTFLGKTLKWALSIGRYIIIFTELVVIGSFATRFSLDRQVTDLNENINQKQSVIESYGQLEDKMRTAQAKIENYQQVDQQKNIVDVFPKLSEITPRDVKLTELTIKPTSVSLVGTATSQNSLNLLINNIQLSPSFFNVAVDRIESSPDESGVLLFRIKADTDRPQSQAAAQKNTEKINVLDRTQGL
jgi:Tfp pilus assembly protein PilN